MKLSRMQRIMNLSPARHRVVVAGRRSGKTFMSLYEMLDVFKYPNRNVSYVGLTYGSAERIMWRFLKQELDHLGWSQYCNINNSKLRIEAENGSQITLAGTDNYNALRGSFNHLLVLDEGAYLNQEAWEKVLYSTLTDTRGRALFCTTPAGRNWVYDLYQAINEKDSRLKKNWMTYQFSSGEAGFIDAEELENMKDTMDEMTYRQEVLAEFVSTSDIVYHAYDPAKNCRYADSFEQELIDNQDYKLVAGMDFNKDKMMMVIGVHDKKNNKLHIFDEIANLPYTEDVIQEYRNRYNSRLLTVYPDATGARTYSSSSPGQSDFMRLMNAGFEVFTGKVNPNVRDSIAAVNGALASKTGKIRLTVSPKCKHLIAAFNKYQYKEGTRIPDKDNVVDHAADAIRYLASALFPIKVEWKNPIRYQPVMER